MKKIQIPVPCKITIRYSESFLGNGIIKNNEVYKICLKVKGIKNYIFFKMKQKGRL